VDGLRRWPCRPSPAGARCGRNEKTTHIYVKAGTYSVTLKVTDNDGGSDVSEKTVAITEPVI